MINKKIKGFTLVELLAVVVVLGIILMIAIPAVNEYTIRAKNKLFVQDALTYINIAKSRLASDGITLSKDEAVVYDITTNDIETTYNRKKSVYGFDYVNAKIIILGSDTGKYTYAINILDSNGNIIGDIKNTINVYKTYEELIKDYKVEGVDESSLIGIPKEPPNINGKPIPISKQDQIIHAKIKDKEIIIDNINSEISTVKDEIYEVGELKKLYGKFYIVIEDLGDSVRAIEYVDNPDYKCTKLNYPSEENLKARLTTLNNDGLKYITNTELLSLSDLYAFEVFDLTASEYSKIKCETETQTCTQKTISSDTLELLQMDRSIWFIDDGVLEDNYDMRWNNVTGVLEYREKSTVEKNKACVKYVNTIKKP